MTTGSGCRQSNPKDIRRQTTAPSLLTRALLLFAPLLVRRRFARIRDDLIELGHGEDARHAKFADDKGRRAPEAERGSLIIVTGEDRVDRLGVGCEIARGAIDIDPRPGEQLADTRLGQ